jgi:GT2 family glycosyltransferase
MDISVIIVNYNTRDMLRSCLRSVAEKTAGVEYETIVVDNCSQDGSAEMVGKEFPRVKLVEPGENLGFGRANNKGSGVASGTFLFFLNSDTELRNDAITIIKDFMASHPDCGIAGGNLVDPEGKPSHSYRKNLPSPATELQRFIPSFARITGGKSWCFNHTGRPMPVAYVTGADLMIRKDLFERVGMFDPDFFMYYEETELTNRVAKEGFGVWSVPEAVIMHIKGASLEFVTGVKAMVYESKYTYMQKVFGTSAAARTHRYFRFYCNCKRAALALTGKKKRAENYVKMLEIDDAAYAKTTGGNA